MRERSGARGVTVQADSASLLDALDLGAVEWVDEVDGMVPRRNPCAVLWDYADRTVYAYNREAGRISGYDADEFIGDGRLGTVYRPVGGTGDFSGEFNLLMLAYDLREVDEPLRGPDEPVHLASPANEGLEVYTASDELAVEAPAAHLDVFATLRDLPGVEPVRQYLKD